MAHGLTAEEVEKRHVQSLGPQLGPVYHALYNELVWLHAKWEEYRNLFGHSEKRIELLNETAGFSFRVWQDALFENVLLHIARLTDSPKSCGKPCLTFRRLPEVISEPSLKSEVSALLERASDLASFSRDWRNRLLAHQDLSLALRVDSNPLPQVSREMVGKALEGFAAVLNKIHEHYIGGEVLYGGLIGSLDDAEALIYASSPESVGDVRLG